jgi:hypothetical protein
MVSKKRSRRKRGADKRQAKIEARMLLRDYVILRDADICQKCDEIVYGRSAHTSHVYSKGKYPRLEFEPANVKLLCRDCHGLWHANPSEAMLWWRSTFPDRNAEMIALLVHENDWQQASLSIHWYKHQLERLRGLIDSLVSQKEMNNEPH